jgi:Concanavalin A-like lectin/glucanases superfamily
VPLLAAYSFDAAHGTADTVTDQSGNGHDFSIAATATERVAGHTAEGLRSNGAGATPSLPDIGSTAQRTVMAWVRDDSPVASWAIQHYVPSIDSGAWGILFLPPNIHIQARSASTLARASAAWTTGTPRHVAGTFDGSAVRLYLDGTLAAETPLAGPLRTDTDPPTLFTGMGNLSGYVDDLRIFDEALGQPDVAAYRDTPVRAASARSRMLTFF